MKNFALTGAAGYVAPKHMKAIRETGNQLVAAVDPHASVGVMDSFFPQSRFFTEVERFDRHLEKLRRKSDEERVHYLSVCSPNYLHDAHVRLALRVGAKAICEKPLVISPWNLEQLVELEAEYESEVYTILQLRLLPQLIALRDKLNNSSNREKAEVRLDYVTRRGPWYHVSWKGSEAHSGGLAMNIGVHFFDLLLWMFGSCDKVEVNLNESHRMAGVLELEWARVRWFLSVDSDDLPEKVKQEGGYAYRSLTIDGEALEFSPGFTDLHTRSYEEILAGRGFRIQDARGAIQLIHRIRTTDLSAPSESLRSPSNKSA